MPKKNTLQIAPQGASSEPLTPQQVRFNTLIRQIEKARKTVSNWQDHGLKFRIEYVNIIEPLMNTYIETKKQWVIALDELYRTKTKSGLTRAERNTLEEVLQEDLLELMGHDSDDPTIRALYEKYADVDLEEEERAQLSVFKSMAESFTGIDLGDDPFNSKEELFERLNKGMHEKAEREEIEQAKRQAQAEQRARENRASSKPKKPPKKTPAQIRREEAEAQTKQSIREIFRKLASALHPDRETDEEERTKKTAMMQRVNQAYEANDLLTLLQLQLEIEQIDPERIAQVSSQRLQQFNQVLSEQLWELKREITMLEYSFQHEFNLELERKKLNPVKLHILLQDMCDQFTLEVRQQELQIKTLEDLPKFKGWLKKKKKEYEHHYAMMMGDFEDSDFFY